MQTASASLSRGSSNFMSAPLISATLAADRSRLVEMPSRMRLQATLSQVSCDHRSEMVHPTPNGLVRHRHSALRQQMLDVTQAEGEPEVEPYCLMDFEPEVSLAVLPTAQSETPVPPKSAIVIFGPGDERVRHALPQKPRDAALMGSPASSELRHSTGVANHDKVGVSPSAAIPGSEASAELTA